MDTPVRILAVDDSVTIRKALELILVPAGFHVEFAVNGAEAIDRAKGFHPQILLLDFILPDMRGTEVCRALLADASTRDIPVVLISARGAEIRQAYHDVENVVDYLTKPFTPDAVLGVLQEVLSAQPFAAASAGDSKAETAPAAAAVPPAAEPAAQVEATPASPPASRQQVAAAPVPPAATEEEAEPEGEARPAAVRRPPPGDLEAMFETLRAGLEGIYVEENALPAAAGERLESFTHLASLLARQLGETLEQVASRQRFRLYGDGSIRSLDESLLEAYRRVCRLLYRAAAAGAVSAAAVERPSARVLIACPRDSDLRAHLPALTELAGAHVFAVSSGFRQLPLLVRLYGPSHLVVEPGRGNAILEPLSVVRRMPESRKMKIAVVASPSDAAKMVDAGDDSVLDGGEGTVERLCRWLSLSPGLPSSPGEAPLPAVATAR